MSIFDNIQQAEITNAHGEVNFIKIISGSVDTQGMEDVKPAPNGFIVGHSESGHHHVLEREGVTMKRTHERGLAILHALITKPVPLKQEAGSPHEPQIVEAGEYIITNNVEYNPFLEQAARVSD